MSGKQYGKDQREARRQERAERLVADALARAEQYAKDEAAVRAAGGQTPPPIVRRAQPGNRKGRTPAQRATDQYVAARLSVQGFTTAQIAAGLGITEAMVQNDLADINAVYKRRATEAVDEHRGRQLMMCDAAASELWGAWMRSKGEQVEVLSEGRRSGGTNPDGTPAMATKVTTKKRTTHGDVNYLFGLKGIMERTARLQGLDKPMEVRGYIDQAQADLTRVMNAVAEALADDPDRLEAVMDKVAALQPGGGQAPTPQALDMDETGNV